MPKILKQPVVTSLRLDHVQPLTAPVLGGTKTVVRADALENGVTTKNLLTGDLKSFKPSVLTGSLGFEAQEVAAYEARNKKTATGKYPTLDKVLADPDAFVADVTVRFAKQKEIDPANPYQFDFSDYAMPVMQQLDTALGAEVEQLQKRLDGTSTAGHVVSKLTGGAAELKKGIGYLSRLKAETSGHLAKGKIDYRRTQELSYFASRALGHFDESQLNLRDRSFLAIDRYLMGLGGTDLDAEIQAYEKNEFQVFENQSPVKGFQLVHKPFEQAFFSKEKLEMISLPSAEHLGPEVFMRLVSYNLFPMGITPDPQAADGFVRPGSDFYAHDMRHSSSIFGRRKIYEAEHRMTEPQIRKLQKRIDVWRAELDEVRKVIPDKELRYAIGFLMFNYHHDRGFPLVPSSYKMESMDKVPRLLHMMLKASDQPIGFSKPKETLDRAWTLLREFWLPKLAEEQAILGDTTLVMDPKNAA